MDENTDSLGITSEKNLIPELGVYRRLFQAAREDISGLVNGLS